jgi:RNA polymerase sigma factor (TIGR02999 family)
MEARRVLDEFFSATYKELCRLAFTVKGNAPSVTLSPTALVHEAWLKLAKSPQVAVTSRLHFKRIAARAMREVLVEAARRRNAQKRGVGVILLTLDDSNDISGSPEQDVLALDEALQELARLEPHHAALVEYRFFGGLEFGEIASALGVSEATVFREWRVARAWLKQRLGQPR